ncbi:RES domain-containing protein [Granulicella aggregans]|uniref:RES domain-containing protein n=1 Tax=Granulicella aggregans TaxID=474949 RepID=A0A7W8E480_9BACT|nr:RES family NAD+ phosphorylase [Granulicella aggregans]MBB5058352.1 RES domain-containing protein [Granulicella aggregans]
MQAPLALWRISEFPDLSGIGAEFASARWHTVGEGKRIVYLAEHPAVALIEVLVNLRSDPALYPEDFQLIRIASVDSIASIDLTPDQLSSIDPDVTVSTQRIGDAWLADRSSALLRVPSIPSPESWNYLLNPLHPDANSLKIEWAKRITYDRRLFQLSK